MHFWNRLPTAALMRLTILAALNLMLGRLVGRWDILLHPRFFLIIVTLNLGLYAVVVYSGTLNKTLIGMMLGGLAATLGTLVYAGMDASSFAFGPFRRVGRLVIEFLINPGIEALPNQVFAGSPLSLWGQTDLLIGYSVFDAIGLIAIIAGGRLARRWYGPNRR